MRPDTHDDDRIARELEALDDALAGRPVDDDLLEWAALAVAVRDERPEPAPAFRNELDSRMLAGFSRARRLPWLPQVPLLPIAGLACAALLLFVVVSSTEFSNDEEQAGSAGGSVATPFAADSEDSGGGAQAGRGEEALELDQESRPSPSSAGATAQAVAPSAKAAPGRNRKVERSASLTLAAPTDELDDVANGVIRVTDRYRGIVLRSSVTAAGDGGYGGFTLQIPTSRLDAAIADLSKLADVRERTQNSQDITGSFVDARESLKDARVERKRLLERLAEAVTVNETAAIRARLRLVSRQIAARRAQVSRVQRRASFATVEVALTGDEAARDDDGAGVWTPGDAWGDALRVLQTALGVLLVALAVLIPVALVAVPLLVAVRMATRRRREAALDV